MSGEEHKRNNNKNTVKDYLLMILYVVMELASRAGALIRTLIKKLRKAGDEKTEKQNEPVKKVQSGSAPQREMSPEERRRRMRAKEQWLRRRRRNLLIKMGAGLLVIILAIMFCVHTFVVKPGREREAAEAKAVKELIRKADRQAAMYDYDAAIQTIKGYEGNYEEKEELVKAVSRYEETKETCQPYPIDEITHIFFHVLIQDPEEAFGENSQMPEGLNIYMATVDEFNKVMESMYEKGYVLVSLSDVAPCTKDEDGNAVFDEAGGQIMLPPGKKPFVLSQDDVCYYHSYEHSGMADKLVIDENGDVKAEYTDAEGNTSIGDYDMIPLLDTFLDEHPDFSYRGAKGIIALTGYNGILGYRTDPTYNTEKDRDSSQQKWLDEHPDFNYEEDCENAKKVAEALKADGWEFASHSWGHMWQDRISDEGFATDAKKWMERVAPLIGGTDIWIYSNGEDVDNATYEERFKVLREYGFNYFCPVDSGKYTTEIYSDYMKQGRRNIDGYRMYYDMIDDDVDYLSDLFDVEEVFDKARPTPVPQI